MCGFFLFHLSTPLDSIEVKGSINILFFLQSLQVLIVERNLIMSPYMEKFIMCACKDTQVVVFARI